MNLSQIDKQMSQHKSSNAPQNKFCGFFYVFQFKERCKEVHGGEGGQIGDWITGWLTRSCVLLREFSHLRV